MNDMNAKIKAAKAALPPAYAASHITNQHGKKVCRMVFDSPADLERFFIEELIGSKFMDGQASKAIGSVLLIWEK